MEEVWKTISARLKALHEHWAVWALAGTAALYLLGYLVVRFQLTLFGVATGLDVVEEQYFFAGARFATYLLAALPSLLLFALPAALLVWVLARLAGNVAFLQRSASRFAQSWRHPIRLRLAGIAWSVIVIQFVMRQCFVLSNLLLADKLPGPAWLDSLVTAEGDEATSLFFAGLTGAALVTIAFFAAARRLPSEQPLAKLLELVLGAVMAIQLLLLPINYSYLIAYKQLPRIKTLSADLLPVGHSAWFIWENDDSTTFLVANRTNLAQDRLLISVPTKDVPVLQITRYDPIFRLLFSSNPPVSNPHIK